MTSERMAMLIVDAQVNMFDPAQPVWAAEELCVRLANLIKRSRAAGVPVIFVRNCGGPGDPDARGTPGWELPPSLAPVAGELVLDKTTGDTFASTALDAELKARGVVRLTVAGMQSEFCVRETTLGALARGYLVTLVSDGHSTYAGRNQSAQEKVAAVNAEFAGRVNSVSAAELRFH